jgi:hypothetical protein
MYTSSLTKNGLGDFLLKPIWSPYYTYVTGSSKLRLLVKYKIWGRFLKMSMETVLLSFARQKCLDAHCEKFSEIKSKSTFTKIIIVLAKRRLTVFPWITGANSTIASYNARAVKICDTKRSLVRFENKTFSSTLKNALPLFCGTKFEQICYGQFEHLLCIVAPNSNIFHGCPFYTQFSFIYSGAPNGRTKLCLLVRTNR